MKNRFRLIAFLSVLLLVTMACGTSRRAVTTVPQTGEENQELLVSETRQMDVFTKIDMKGGAAINLVQGNEHSIKVESTRRVADQLVTEVKDGVLVINYRDKKLFDLWLDKLTLTITFKDLSEFKLDGGAELKADGLDLENLKFEINGGVSVKLNNLVLNTLNMTMAGGGDIRASGEAQNLTIDVSGGTNFEAGDLKVANVDMKVDGAASVVVWATDTLNLDLAGAYNVSYWGSPEITQSIGGIGQVKALGNK